MSFIVSHYMLELKLDGIAWVTSADVQRFGDRCPMLQVSHPNSHVSTSKTFPVRLTLVLHVLSLEHCVKIDDAAFALDMSTNLLDVNVSYCVALTDIGILRLSSCSPRLQVLNM